MDDDDDDDDDDEYDDEEEGEDDDDDDEELAGKWPNMSTQLSVSAGMRRMALVTAGVPSGC